ncbi:MAG: DoxX family protein [Nanoarchaeota archaeon]|nr:DoxX family protein [Nanoarchaeota archaeon]
MNTEILILLGAIPLRIVLGLIYIIHGFPKLKDPERTATIFLRKKIPLPKVSAILIAITEFFGGIMLLFGFTTRIVAALLLIIMVVAVFLEKQRIKESYEYYMLLIAGLLTLFLLGSGNLSVDQTFGWLLG